MLFVGCRSKHRDADVSLTEFEWLTENMFVGGDRRRISEVEVNVRWQVLSAVVCLG